MYLDGTVILSDASKMCISCLKLARKVHTVGGKVFYSWLAKTMFLKANNSGHRQDIKVLLTVLIHFCCSFMEKIINKLSLELCLQHSPKRRLFFGV
jgi:hypothetical protein